jgi:transcriptional accessory protein Tex/SPT6
MIEKVAVATVQGKAYYFIVSKLREHDIPFISLVPADSVPAKIQIVITTEQEKSLVNHEKILILHSEEELGRLVDEIKVLLLGKTAFQKIVFGLDPGAATGLVAVADGKVIEEANCFSTKEVIGSILKVLRNVRFEVTKIIVKIGNGVPVYKDLLKSLDDALPSQIILEVVNEAGTNKPLKENKRSRRVRHISSATCIAGRAGNIVQRGNSNATHNRIQ